MFSTMSAKLNDPELMIVVSTRDSLANLSQQSNYLGLTDNLSKRPTVDHSGIHREHQDATPIEDAIIRHGSEKVPSL